MRACICSMGLSANQEQEPGIGETSGEWFEGGGAEGLSMGLW